MGFVNDKDVENIISLFPQNAIYYLCEPDVPRAMKLNTLEKIATKLKLNYFSEASVTAALKLARKKATKNDVIFIGGSTFVVAEVV